VAADWQAYSVIPLKKQVHLRWKYNGLQDPTQETTEKIHPDLLMKLLEEMFQNTSSWPIDKQVSSYHIGVERDPVRYPSFNQHYNFLKSQYSYIWMQALDSFISPIPGYEVDIPIPTIPVLAQSPSGESASDLSARAHVKASRTRAGKRKAATNPTRQKKNKKATWKSSSGIRINEPTPKASPAPTPPSGSWQKIPIHRSKRYTHYVYFPFLIGV
jgi:hypothetical protein